MYCCLSFGKGGFKVITYKTVLAPNAPWPVFEQVVARPKRANKYKIPKKTTRSKPSVTDQKFQQWLDKINKGDKK